MNQIKTLITIILATICNAEWAIRTRNTHMRSITDSVNDNNIQGVAVFTNNSIAVSYKNSMWIGPMQEAGAHSGHKVTLPPGYNHMGDITSTPHGSILVPVEDEDRRHPFIMEIPRTTPKCPLTSQNHAPWIEYDAKSDTVLSSDYMNVNKVLRHSVTPPCGVEEIIHLPTTLQYVQGGAVYNNTLYLVSDHGLLTSFPLDNVSYESMNQVLLPMQMNPVSECEGIAFTPDGNLVFATNMGWLMRQITLFENQ